MFPVYVFFSSHTLCDFIKLKLHLYQDQDGRDLIVVCLCLQGAYFQRQAGGLNFEIISMFSLAILSSVWRQKVSIYAPITMSQIPILHIVMLQMD